MSDDRRTGQKPRVKARPTDAELASARRARHAAEGAPKNLRRETGARRTKKPVPPEVAARRRAEKLYPDDAYYQRKRPADAGKRPKKKSRKKRNNWGRSIAFTTVAVAAALLVSFLIHSFVFQVIRVSGDSMYSTLLDGDWVCITKYDYWTDAPQRGDIVAVSVQGGGVILRRVVGMPGEKLAIDGNGDTLINGDPLGERYVTLKNYDEYPELGLPGGRYFVLSDNRSEKLDSRDPSVDVISRQNIIGKVKAILFPFERSGVVQ